MMRLISLFVVIVAALSGTAFACSCIGFGSAAEQVLSTDVVFEGIALKTQKVEGPDGFQELKTTFEVTTSFKGGAGATVTVFHSDPAICCICGVGFSSGDTYLIFAHDKQDGSFGTSSCSSPQFPRSAYDEIFHELLEAQK